MFGRLINVRIKAAEEAFDHGRLDEAFEIVASPDLESNARIQSLRPKVAAALVQDGQNLMMDRHFSDARSSFVRAARLHPSDPQIGEWIARANDAIASEQAADQRREAALREARQRMEAGSLNGAAAALRHAPMSDADGQAVNNEIARRAEKATDLMNAAENALKENRIQSAVDNLIRARTLNARQEGLAELESGIVHKITVAATQAFCEGRLDRATADVRLMQPLGESTAERREIEAAVNLSARSAAALQNAEYDEADVLLGRVTKICPRAKWAIDAKKCLRSIEANRRSLLEGPLGMAASLVGSTPNNAAPVTDETMPAARHAAAAPAIGVRKGIADNPAIPQDAGRLPRRLLLRIDGIGSFLLIRGDRISVGRSGPGATADIQLLSDLSERHADIVRGEDYFVVSQSGVELAGNATDHALLQDGDRIRLSRRVRLTFARPSLKSTAASLELGEGVRMPTECRRIILWSGPVLLGATKECHIRLASTLGDFVLAERGGRLFFKAMRGDAGRNIELGEQITIGELSLRITDWNTSVGSRGTAIS